VKEFLTLFRGSEKFHDSNSKAVKKLHRSDSKAVINFLIHIQKQFKIS